MLEQREPRIHFLLGLHHASSPVVRVLSPHNLDRHLQAAAEDYCASHIIVDVNESKVTLPMLFSWYQADFFVPESGHEENPIKVSPSGLAQTPSVSRLSSSTPLPDSVVAALDAVVGWLPADKRRAVAKLADDPSLELAYAYDWTPYPKPGI